MTRQRPSSSSSSAQAPVGQINMIGQGAVIEGTLQVSGDIRIGGKVIGEVEVDGKLISTEEGVIEGNVRTNSGDIAGTLKGSIVAAERLVLRNTSRIDGDIRTPKLVIEEGAVFTGKCDMSGKTSASGNSKRPQPGVQQNSPKPAAVSASGSKPEVVKSVA